MPSSIGHLSSIYRASIEDLSRIYRKTPIDMPAISTLSCILMRSTLPVSAELNNCTHIFAY